MPPNKQLMMETWTSGVRSANVNVGSVAVWRSPCRNNCTLVNISVHDNVGGRGIDVRDNTTNTHITGGRVTNNSVLGIGGSTASYLTIDGVEIDHTSAPLAIAVTKPVVSRA